MGVVGSLLGGFIGSNAAGSAANDQRGQATNALKAQDEATAYNRANQAPFIAAGQQALDTQQNQINATHDSLWQLQNIANNAAPQAMTEANLIKTPGYQFNLSQGLEATQNAAAARGLGVSGAAMKGAATYATGLADDTYQKQFANQQTQYMDANQNLNNQLNINNQSFNQNASRVGTGLSASNSAGNQAQQNASNIGNIDTSLGNALGASQIAQGNAWSGAINGVGNALNAGLLAAFA